MSSAPGVTEPQSRGRSGGFGDVAFGGVDERTACCCGVDERTASCGGGDRQT
jgi:hypothetical protein